jgi:hypothetical protein
VSENCNLFGDEPKDYDLTLVHTPIGDILLTHPIDSKFENYIKDFHRQNLLTLEVGYSISNI